LPSSVGRAAADCRQLERRCLVERYDLLNRQSLVALEADTRALAPNDVADDHMLTAPKLDLVCLRSSTRRMNEQASRGNVQNACIAPLGAVAQAGRNQHSTPELARPLGLTGFRRIHCQPS
jgi:hypothetical protein